MTEDLRYKRANAAHKIDGYMITSTQDKEADFTKAKEELLYHLAKEIEFIKNMTLDEFIAGMRGK